VGLKRSGRPVTGTPPVVIGRAILLIRCTLKDRIPIGAHDMLLNPLESQA
jgi:flavin reductase (DIM6/NTAB) family NADH-FMN oxidoreductase RutF